MTVSNKLRSEVTVSKKAMVACRNHSLPLTMASNSLAMKVELFRRLQLSCDFVNYLVEFVFTQFDAMVAKILSDLCACVRTFFRRE